MVTDWSSPSYDKEPLGVEQCQCVAAMYVKL